MARIDGKAIADTILAKARERVRAFARPVKLAVVLVGDDKPSHTYVRKKGEAAHAIGIDFHLEQIPASASTADVQNAISRIQNDEAISGLIVQLPLPNHIDTQAVQNTIRPDIDVDCLTDKNLGKLVMNTQAFLPPTPGAVMSILEQVKVDLAGANVTIVGVGPLVGKPLAIIMMNERASVTTVNSQTRDTKEKCLMADIIITGVGKKNILRGDMVSTGAIVIDTGVSFEDGEMSGDVNVSEVEKVAAYVTPTPGGVGPVTVARLLFNTVLCAEARYAR
jgi:methylenetetrahydrofolate dehydrogenase (NADP+)/methenyltetrahydrofolate cyclohydrolase